MTNPNTQPTSKKLPEISTLDSYSAVNMCDESPVEGRHIWDTIGIEEQGILKQVCRFCAEVIYD